MNSRRFREGLRWETDVPPAKQDIMVRFIDTCIVIAVLLGLLGLYSHVQVRDAEAKAEDAKAAEQRWSKRFADCLNGAGFLANGDTGLFCGKAIEVKL